MNNVPMQQPKASPLAIMAQRFDIEPLKLYETLRATVIKPTKDGRQATNEEVAAFVIVANQYGLNPFTRQIHAFIGKDGGVVPVVGIDGWVQLTNQHASFDGCEFIVMNDELGQPVACTCRMHVKGRSHPIEVTEWMTECRRDSGPWKSHPRRMLRHKAYIQCARICFGFAGIYDEEEAEDIAGIQASDPAPLKPPIGRVNSRRNRQLAAPPVASEPPQPSPPAPDESELANPRPWPAEAEPEHPEAAPEPEAQAEQGGAVDLADDLIDEMGQAQTLQELNNGVLKMERLRADLGTQYQRVREYSELRASQIKYHKYQQPRK